jgi:competence ComEA-like helix-hairpin-helix protein
VPARLILFGAVLLAATPARAGKGIDGVVNLNTAPVTVLALLPGVGPSKAAAIAGYRARRPFRTVDELVRIKGIGRKMVRRLRPHLAVSGPTTATAAAQGATPVPPPPPARPPPPLPRCPAPPQPARRPRGELRDPTPRGTFRSACAGAS